MAVIATCHPPSRRERMLDEDRFFPRPLEHGSAFSSAVIHACMGFNTNATGVVRESELSGAIGRGDYINVRRISCLHPNSQEWLQLGANFAPSRRLILDRSAAKISST